MSRLGLAGLDTSGVRQVSKLGIAGLDHKGKFGIAGINCRSIADIAKCGIAGEIRQTKLEVLESNFTKPNENHHQLGDVADQIAWQYGVYFADYTYVVCTADRGKGDVLRWRSGRNLMFGPEHRKLPLFLDSTGFRRFTGKAPKWTSMATYLKAIDLCQPEAFMAYDVIGNQAQSVKNFALMADLGYGPERGCIPVYQVGPMWNDKADMRAPAWSNIPQAARCAVANAAIAATDPILQHYASQSQIIGIGGMVKGPCPRDVRHYYFAELCRQFPDHHFWGLGQANFKVVNGLGSMGLLERVWLDGTWFILDAACARFAVVEKGRLKMLSLEGTTAKHFFTLTEMMAANLRSLLSAYAGLWDWPPPDPLPLNLHDQVEVLELHDRIEQAKMELFGDNTKMYGNIPVRVE